MAEERRDIEYRPSPEALLEAARREEVRAGRLMIFVGAAPGVGKTYTMLETARARKKDGYDVVVGIVETLRQTRDGRTPARPRSHPAPGGRI